MTEENKTAVFVEEYLKTWSAGKAYKKACPDVTKGSAYTLGASFLKTVEVQEYLKARIAEKHMSAEEVIDRLTRLGRAGNIRALAILSKVHGLQIERSEVDVRGVMSWSELVSGGEGGNASD